jgi:hypothetical protein
MTLYAVGWCHYLCSRGLPREHIAFVLELSGVDVADFLARRAPSRCYMPRPDSSRPILGPTAGKVDRMAALGYTAAQIARTLCLRPKTVSDRLARTTGTDGRRLVKTRTPQEQARVEATRQRREEAQTMAAERAAWRWAEDDDDHGALLPLPGRRPPSAPHGHADVPTGVELEPNRWNETPDPRARTGSISGRARLTWDEVDEIRRQGAAGETAYAIAKDRGLNAGTVRAILKGQSWPEVDRPFANRQVDLEVAASSPEAAPAPARAPRPKRWRPSPKAPKLFARGSGARWDDELPPSPAPDGGKSPDT